MNVDFEDSASGNGPDPDAAGTSPQPARMPPTPLRGGLVIVEPTDALRGDGRWLISPPLVVGNRPTGPRPALHNSEDVNGWRELNCGLRRQGRLLCAQLTGSGVPLTGVGTRGEPLIHDIEAFRDAAENALDAGFEGIELHAGLGSLGGQLLDQHAALTRELLQVLFDVWEPARVGIRVDLAHAAALARELGPERATQLAWVHVSPCTTADLPGLHRVWPHRGSGTLLVSGGFDARMARIALTARMADRVGVDLSKSGLAWG